MFAWSTTVSFAPPPVATIMTSGSESEPRVVFDADAALVVVPMSTSAPSKYTAKNLSESVSDPVQSALAYPNDVACADQVAAPL